MAIDRINPGELVRPSGFSHAVSASGGRMVFLAGQTGYGPDGQTVGGGVVGQVERALANLLAALRAAGGGPADLASLALDIGDMDGYLARRRGLGQVGGRAGAGRYPATWRRRG